MTNQSRLQPLALCIALTLLIPQTVASQVSDRLVVLQRYGWDDPTGPVGQTTPAQRRLDGGMLAQVVDLAEGDDDTLDVLDRDGFKVVAFAPNGAVKRVIGRGRGQGPGEFTRATSLALSDAGELFVLDVGQQRITVFDTAGTFQRTFPIASPGAFQVRAQGDRLFISQYIFRAGVPNILVYDANGTLLERRVTPSDEDVSFGRTGNTYRMAPLSDGRIAIANPDPGTWRVVDEPSRQFGRPSVERNEVRQPTGSTAWIAPATLRGFGQLTDGRTLILFDRLKAESLNTPERPLVNIYLGIVERGGVRTETIETGEVGRNLLVSRAGTSFYMTVAEPTYQVVRFRLATP